jgi:hypothetical protein
MEILLLMIWKTAKVPRASHCAYSTVSCPCCEGHRKSGETDRELGRSLTPCSNNL